MLTNESGASTVILSRMATIKIESSGDDVLVLLDSYEDVCHVVDHSDTTHFPYKNKPSNLVLVSMDVDRFPHNLSYMKLVCHSSSSQRPPLHLSSIF